MAEAAKRDQPPLPAVTSPDDLTQPVVLVCSADGSVTAASAGLDALVPGGIGQAQELLARYRQTDGIPIALGGRARRVAVPSSGDGPAVLIMTEPLDGRGPQAGDATLAVVMLPLGPEGDPLTTLRAVGSILAHELRTPLTTIYAGAELLASRRLSDAARETAGESVARETDRLNRAIEDLIVFVRGDLDVAGEPELVLLQHVVGDVVERRGTWSSTPRFEVMADAALPPILASPAHLEHALRNVIEHAALNAPPGTSVQIAIAHVDGTVEVRVRDHGPGRDAPAAARAFELFASGAREAGDASGANLSLVVARRLIERLGGSARAEASSGGELVLAFPAVG